MMTMSKMMITTIKVTIHFSTAKIVYMLEEFIVM
jgi:hypothetical protein